MPCRTLVAGDHTLRLDVDGTQREVLVHVPPRASSGEARLPLLLAFHGYTATADELARSAALSGPADEDGFVVAFPQGLASGGPTDWHFPGRPGDPPGSTGDLRFVEVLLDLAAAEGCIDTARVFVMGHSMGGGMADATACAFAERIAGAVLVSAVQFGGPCDPTRPVPIVALHALDDEVLPYAGGRIAGTPGWFPDQQPVEDAIARWAIRDRCVGGPVTTDRPYGAAVLIWPGCQAPVVLHREATGGHAYPALASQLLQEMITVRPSDAEVRPGSSPRCPGASPTYAGSVVRA
jgi:polyhydroxybutyrate depolymerase